MRKILVLSLLGFSLLAFQRVTLKSGTRVIYQQDRSYPLVSVAIAVEAGSSYEAPAERGLSHFLEHMLFDGTFRRDRDSLEKAFADLGTYYNAFTRKDYVVFEFVSPPSALLPSFRLISEMLFLSSFPEKEFEKEKGVVYQEIIKDYANPVAGSSYEFYRRFLEASPYAEPVLGYPEVIKNLTRERVMDFWRRYYAPSRMKVVILGDFSFEAIRPELERIFSFPRQGTDTPAVEVHPRWGGMDAVQSRVSRLDLALEAPSPCQKGSGRYELLARILARRLMKEISLPRVSGEYEKHRNFGFIHLSSLIRGKTEGRNVEEALKRILSEPVSSPEVEVARKWFLSSRIMVLEKKIHLAREVAGWEVLCPGRYSSFVDEVNTADVKAVDSARVKVEKSGKYYGLLQGPQFRREVFKAISPRVNSSRLPNGLRYALFQGRGRIYAAHILVGRRAWVEDFPGQVHLLMKTLEKELEGELERAGVSAQFTDYPFFPFDDFYLSKDYAYVRLEGYSSGALEKLVCRILQTPLSPEAFRKAKEEVLWELGYLSSRPSWAAGEALRAMLFKPPLSYPLYGNRKLVEGARFADLQELRARAFSASNIVYTASWSSLPPCLDSLPHRSWKGSPAFSEKTQFSPHPKNAAYGLGWKLKWGKSDYPVYMLLAWALRDALVEEVRERRGLAYSVGSSFVPYSNGEGSLEIIIPTGKKALPGVKEAVSEVLSRFSPEKIGPEDFHRLKVSLASRVLRYGERKINRAYYTGYYLYLGFSPDYLYKLPALIEKIPRARLVEAWQGLGKPVEVVLK